MPSFRTKRVVPHSPGAMFDLVADVERYPHFVPLCERLVVRSRTPSGEGGEVVVATMTIAYKMFRESFTSRVTLDRARGRIDVTYLDGPFRMMDNRWIFAPTADPARCAVDFHLAYEFKSRTLGLVMGAVFDKVFSRFAEAFERRADVVYGRAGAVT
jgi:coenzyme Q-binding protein COQ10